MSVDHSVIYKKKSIFKNSAVRRLDEIYRILAQLVEANIKTLVDVGCSNGYLTNLISEKFQISQVIGLDNDEDNLEIAKKLYPNIQFKTVNLNEKVEAEAKYDIVTCLETLEHVGNLNQALENILSITNKNGNLVIAVPIEIGYLGLTKLIYRILRYGINSYYVFQEFQSRKNFLLFSYTFSLLTKQRMSRFRYSKSHWSTHLGFDYRDIDDWFKQQQVNYSAYNKNGSRFYIVRKLAEGQN
ncbi:MAG: class I SAM-dependent methyltransferase [Halanaerobiales bacterium]